jgi:hypothetical protein
LKIQDHTPTGEGAGLTPAASYEEFMALAEKSDPERFTKAAEKYPVLSRRQMRTRAEREVPISQFKDREMRIAMHDLFYAGLDNEDFDNG